MVDNPEFKELLLYVHHPTPTIKIPGCHAIQRQAMKMGEDGIEVTKKMFAVCFKLKFKIFVIEWYLFQLLGIGL